MARFLSLRGAAMSTKSTEVKVGVAVIIAVIILILGILWIGEFRLSRRLAGYSVYFDEVGGLTAGDPVTVSGLEMGKVSGISLEGSRVRTELLIEEEVVLREDCTVEIRSIGLMGEKYIHVMPGTAGDTLVPGSLIEGEYKAGLPDVVAGMGDVMDDMRDALRSFSRMVSTESGDHSLAESMAKLNAVSSEIITLLRENRDDIRSTTKSMKSVSENLNDVIGRKKEELIGSIDKFSSAAGRLDSLTISLRGVVRSVEKGDGTLGMLIKEKRIHEQIEATLEDLQTLVNDIRAHPERYLTIEIF
jgi:phospholipid/cholesterol/gamma-HCH transport system substrate-binding protein